MGAKWRTLIGSCYLLCQGKCLFMCRYSMDRKGYYSKSHKILLVGDIFLGLSCVFMIVEAELESRTTNLMRRAPTRTTVPNPIVDGSILLIWISVPIRAKMTGSKMIHIWKIYNFSFLSFSILIFPSCHFSLSGDKCVAAAKTLTGRYYFGISRKDQEFEGHSTFVGKMWSFSGTLKNVDCEV